MDSLYLTVIHTAAGGNAVKKPRAIIFKLNFLVVYKYSGKNLQVKQNTEL